MIPKQKDDHKDGASMHVTLRDIEKLAKNPSADARADIAGKVAATLSSGAFNEGESLLALDILRVLVRDVEVRVRKSVATHLRDSLTVPRDMVLELARDVPEVSVPLLRYSYLLTEEDLVQLVRSTREVVKLVAVASRESISEPLSEALLETETGEVVRALLANRGAVVREHQLLKRWDYFTRNQALLEVLVHRGGLPATVAEKLYSVVSDEMKSTLSKMYRLPLILVEEAMDDAREWSLLGITSPEGSPEEFPEQELQALVDQLYANNRLTYSLIIRSLCVGDMPFFETAMAKLAGVPRANARILMFDQGPDGFQSFYRKARMPEGFLTALHTLLKISLEETNYGRFRRDDFRNRVIARIQSAGFDRSVENMQYLLTIIGGKIASAETLH